MVAKINTIAFHGVSVQSVDVQVQISNGLPAFTIVGLPDKAVAESKERVRAALHALGIALPAKRLTVNLAPADVMKEGSHYDLPIALGLLTAMEILPKEEMERYVVLGELSLDAAIRSVAGVLPAAIHAASNDNSLICPEACGHEAVWAGEIEILAPSSLLQLINHIKGTQMLARPEGRVQEGAQGGVMRVPDLSQVKGQESAKRALEVAAAGGHNLLLIGPPGAGKSMLSSCLPGILPPLSPREALEVSMIHSLAGTLEEGGLVRARPYRSPHHSASLPALVGGGHKARPGEISLAHRGVLFLDELPEFSRATLESLRQPLETGQAVVSRANAHVAYPAKFQLIAAMNPCRCGYLGDAEMECTKAPRCGGDYQAKLSGPLLDRIDIQVEVGAVSLAALGQQGDGEPSSRIASRVAEARAKQEERYRALGAEADGIFINAHAGAELVEKTVRMSSDVQAFFLSAAERLKLSARAYHRLMKVCLTLSDLSGHDGEITQSHVAEALSYRRLRGF
ncbi:MAG: AAA family ATPase [Micavibrio aeruginosavorus]|uniref:AAA family ATPase n=1 Tax=Micavibrio aeruginosavorus TaxID=349221 RepID=A0A2W5C3Z8_9BACT|nr:MAG: AAA family ATPase [Micavibrio aeruginosavorus]